MTAATLPYVIRQKEADALARQEEKTRIQRQISALEAHISRLQQEIEASFEQRNLLLEYAHGLRSSFIGELGETQVEQAKQLEHEEHAKLARIHEAQERIRTLKRRQ